MQGHRPEYLSAPCFPYATPQLSVEVDAQWWIIHLLQGWQWRQQGLPRSWTACKIILPCYMQPLLYAARDLRDPSIDHPPVLHGGSWAAFVLFAVRQQFGFTLRRYNPWSILISIWIIIRVADAGDAAVDIRGAKLGASMSTVYFNLVQGEKERAAGYTS